MGGGGGGLQNNFKTRVHQNIFNLILTYIFIYLFFFFFLGGGILGEDGITPFPPAPIGNTAMDDNKCTFCPVSINSLEQFFFKLLLTKHKGIVITFYTMG